jgi:seryl-tRNA synthetase
MIDIKIIRENPQLLKDALQRRNMDPAIVDQVAQLARAGAPG